MTVRSLSSITEALTSIVFDMRSRKAADDVVVAIRRARLNSVPPWADIPVILALYWKLRQMRDLGFKAHIDQIVPLNGEGVCGLVVAGNLRLHVWDVKGEKANSSDAPDGTDVNSGVFGEFLVEREIAEMLGREMFNRLCRLELGPEWYKSKWPPVPTKLYKWINVCEADLNASGFANCNEAKRFLSKLRADGIGIFKEKIFSTSLADELDVFSL